MSEQIIMVCPIIVVLSLKDKVMRVKKQEREYINEKIGCDTY